MPKVLRPPHPFSNGTAPPDRAGSLPPRDSGSRYMPTGFAQQDSDQISRPFANNTSSPTARQSTNSAQRKYCQKNYTIKSIKLLKSFKKEQPCFV